MHFSSACAVAPPWLNAVAALDPVRRDGKGELSRELYNRGVDRLGFSAVSPVALRGYRDRAAFLGDLHAVFDCLEVGELLLDRDRRDEPVDELRSKSVGENVLGRDVVNCARKRYTDKKLIHRRLMVQHDEVLSAAVIEFIRFQAVFDEYNRYKNRINKISYEFMAGENPFVFLVCHKRTTVKNFKFIIY